MTAVLLLHDQMLDARVWRGFADLLSGHADVRTVTAPVPAVFRGRPSEWAADVETAAPSGPVDLVLGVGWAVGAALSLVERGNARRALLVNPWAPAAVSDAGAGAGGGAAAAPASDGRARAERLGY